MGNKKAAIPLNDLEMFKLLQACYPDKFPNNGDETWSAALEFAENLSGLDELADLLGRVAMLTIPVSIDAENYFHCIGKVKMTGDEIHMTTAVRRDAVKENQK